jgi:hypothetical protein
MIQPDSIRLSTRETGRRKMDMKYAASMVALVAGVSGITSAAFADPAVFFNGDLAAGENTFLNTLAAADAAYNAANPGATQSSNIFRFDLTNTTGSDFSTTSNGTTVWVSTTLGGVPALNNALGDERNDGFTNWSVGYQTGNFNSAITAGYQVSFFADATRTTPFLMNAFGLNVSNWGTCCTNSGTRPDGSAAGASEIYMLFSGSTPILVGGISSTIPGEEHFVGAIDDRNSFSTVTLVPNGIGEFFGAGGIITFSTVQINSVPAGGSVVTVGTPDINAAFTTTQLAASQVNPVFVGGTLSAATTSTINNSFTVGTGGGTFNSNGNTLTVTGPITNASGATGALSVTGGGRIILSGNNTFTGGVFVDGGVLQLDSTTAAGTGTIHMVNPTLVLNAAGTYANDIALEVPGTPSADPSVFQNTSGGLVVLAGEVRETLNNGGVAGQYVTFDGGTTQLDNTGNFWTGVTTINNGTTLIGQTQTISGTSIVNNGTVDFVNTTAGTSTQDMSGSGAINIGGTAATTLAGYITTTGQLSVNGDGASLILAGGRASANSTGAVVSGAGASLTVADGASIQSGQFNGVRVTGAGASVLNFGTIQNSGTGADGAVGAGVYVQNAGAGGTTTVTNGSAIDAGAGAIIQGRNAGVRHENGSTDTLVVNNHGYIIGDLFNGVENTAGGLIVNNFAGGFIYAPGNGIVSNTGLSVANAGTIGRDSGNVTAGGYGISGNAGLTLDNQTGGLIVGTLGGISVFGTISGSNSGTITGANGSAITARGTLGTFTNAAGGLISTSAGGTWAFLSPIGDVTLSNSGTISNSAGTSIGGAIRIDGGNLNLTNAAGGVLSSTNGWTIYQSSGTATITNSGTITAAGSGYGFLTNGGNSTITNNAGGIIEATGINAAIFGNGSGTLDITNAGIIRGNTTSGSGVVILSGTGGSFTNLSGGQLTSTGIRAALSMTSAGATTVDLQAGSTVTGEILSQNTGSRTVNIAGVLNGAYNASTGTGVDSLTLASTGSMTSANLGAGNDSFVYQGGTFTGLIAGGTGTDDFASDLGAGVARSVNLANVDGFETITHRSGDLTLTGSGTSGAASIFAGLGVPSGNLIFDGTTGLTGDIFVNGATIRAATAGAFGTGTIHLINPTVVYGTTGIYANNISLEVQSPASGNPSTLRAETGAFATLTGAITQGVGAGVDPVQPLVIDGSGIIHLTNTANSWAGTTTINSGAILLGTTQTISGSDLLVNGTLQYTQPTSGTLTQNATGTGTIAVAGLGAGQTFTVSSTLDMTNTGLRVSDASALDVTGVIRSANNLGVAMGVFGSTDTSLLTNSGTISGTGGVYGYGRASVTNQVGGVISGTTDNTVRLFGAGSSLDNAGSITGATTFSGIFFDSSGSVINRAGATISNTGNAVNISGPTGSVDNSGTISTANNQTAVFLTGIGTVINRAGGSMSGGNAIQVAANSTVTNAGTLTGTIGSAVVLNGTGTLVNQTGGTIVGVLSGVNAVSGTATVTNAGMIQGGTGAGVRFAGGGSFENLSGGSIVGGTAGGFVSAGAFTDTVTLRDGSSLTGGVFLAGSDDTLTLDLGASVSGLLDGGDDIDAFVVDGAGSTTLDIGGVVNFESRALNGTGTLTLTGMDTSTTAWDINAGTLAVSGGSAINDAAAVNLAAGGTLSLLNSERIGALNGAGMVTLGANTLVLAGTSNFSGVASGTGGLAIEGGTVTLSGANTYSGATIVSGGTLALGASDVLSDETTVSVASGATFDLAAFDDTVALALLEGTLAGTGTLTAAQYQLDGATVNANLGAGTLFNTGGLSTLNGTSGASAINVNGGVLTLGASDRLLDTATLSVASGATFDLATFDDTVALALLSGTLAGTGTLTAAQYQLDGATVNANLGAGTLFNLGGVSTLNGTSGASAINVNGGVLTLGGSDRLLDTATLSVASGATFDLASFDDTVALALLSGTLSGTGTLAAAQYQLNGATVNANLGAGTLFNTGGVSTLNGTSGAATVTVQAGTLAVGASNRLADNATVSVAAGSILNLNAFNDTVGLALLNGTLAGTGTLTAGQYQLNGATVNANLGAGTLFNLGGLSILNGTAAASQLQINAGTLRLGANERLSDTAVVSVESGATFNVNGFNEQIGALFGTGNVDVGAGRLTFGGVDSGFGGRLSGTGSLVHTGGLFTLMGDHTIATISNTGGELRFLGSTTGRIAVSGGSLTGAGTIGGALTASNGGIISPGLSGTQNGIGGFTAGGLTLNGGTLAIDVLGRTGGNLIDQLRINGTANLTGGLLRPTFQGSAANDFDFSTRYLFLQANSLIGTFTNGTNFTAAGPDGLFWRIRYDLAPNAAVLELREMTNFDPGTTGSNNQRSVGRTLSGGQMEASDDWANVLGLLAGLDAAGQVAAFDSIGGEGLVNVATSVFSANDGFLNAVRRGGFAEYDTGGEALNFAGQVGFNGAREDNADRLGDVLTAFDPSASTERRSGGWVSAYTGDQSLEGKPGTATVDSRLNGFAGGYGLRRGNISIGVAGGMTYLEGDVSARRTSYESDLSHVAAYAAFSDGVWAADLTASFYDGDLATQRGITVGAFSGQAFGESRVEGQTLSASLARRFQVSENTVVSLGAIGTATNATVAGYTETGAGALSLQILRTERDWQTLQLSARGTQSYRINGQQLRLYAGGGVMGTAGDRDATGDMRFTGAPTGFGAFTIEGAETPPLAGLVDVGVEYDVASGVSFTAGYRGVFSERLEDNQFGVKVKFSW